MAEGVRLLEEAFRHRARPNVVYYAPSVLSDRGTRLIGRFRSQGIKTSRATSSELSSMTGTMTSQGILATFPIPVTELTQLHHHRMRNILVCDGLSDPGNLGTLIRSALAFGFDMILLCNNCAEPYSPKVVRASAGAIFAMPIAITGPAQAVGFAKSERFATIAADVAGTNSLDNVLRQLSHSKMMLAIGSEAEGLCDDLLTNADFRVRVPHAETVDSLNAAIAGSILMKDCYSSRHRRKQ